MGTGVSGTPDEIRRFLPGERPGRAMAPNSYQNRGYPCQVSERTPYQNLPFRPSGRREYPESAGVSPFEARDESHPTR
jgi:hypothetical protein